MREEWKLIKTACIAGEVTEKGQIFSFVWYVFSHAFYGKNWNSKSWEKVPDCLKDGQKIPIALLFPIHCVTLLLLSIKRPSLYPQPFSWAGPVTCRNGYNAREAMLCESRAEASNCSVASAFMLFEHRAASEEGAPHLWRKRPQETETGHPSWVPLS